jgi:UDPglucose--hexose-1-phosphate uridylyltransferase
MESLERRLGWAAIESSTSAHRRYNPLNREWVLVSPHRTQRPWHGQEEAQPNDKRLPYDPSCYLCPGNVRASGERNPAYSQTHVFPNDFPALTQDRQREVTAPHPLLAAQSESGICRVMCFSPRHDLSLGEIDLIGLTQVIELWTEQYEELGRDPLINHVQIFENRGAMMGASNPHPHGQIWATEHIPRHVANEQEAQLEYQVKQKCSLLADYMLVELGIGERTICVNRHFVVVVPFWAVWPYETLVISRRQVGKLTDLDTSERASLADILRRLVARYDNLYHVPFPYSMGVHQAPTDGRPHSEWHLHLHFYPPLLRSATVRKFLVGFELLAEPQRDITPEEAAKKLRLAADHPSRLRSR